MPAVKAQSGPARTNQLSTRDAAESVISRAVTVAQRHGRSDLVDRLAQTSRRLADPSVRVLVVGEFKQGKSQLINALVGAPACAVDDHIASSVPVEVLYSPEPFATLLYAPAGESRAPDEEAIPLDRLRDRITEVPKAHTSGNDERRVIGARVGLPRTLLEPGLRLVDTPGVGGLSSTHATRTLAALPDADAVLLVSDAGAEFTSPEIGFLRQALEACPTVACVLTKTDLYPDWQRIAEVDREHLVRLGLDLPLLPVSSTLRLAALEKADAEANRESGFPELVNHLSTQVLARRDAITRASVGHDAKAVADSLRLAVTAQKQALEDPESVPAMLATLTEAKERAEELKRRSSRWQVTLSDGVTDLTADLDHDLRDRLRSVTREAEAAIDTGDPGEAWHEFADWFEARVEACLADTFLWAERNAQWLTEQVGQHFADDAHAAAPAVTVKDIDGLVDPVGSLGELDAGELKAAQKVIIGMRGSYGGVLMFGLITGFAGLALVNPISVGAGLLLGTRAYRDDAENRLKRRRGEAKSLVRRYIDDVTFHVGKQLRDRLRVVQRTVRDHYTEVAAELSLSISASVDSAQKAVKTSAADRDRELTVAKRDLAAIEDLLKAVSSLTRPSPQAVSPRPSTSGSSTQPAAGTPAPAARPGRNSPSLPAPRPTVSSTTESR